MKQTDNNSRSFFSAIAVLLCLLLLGFFTVKLWLNEHWEAPEIRGELTVPNPPPTFLEQDGVAYQLRDNMSSILLLGFGADTDPRLHINLIVLDHKAQTIQRIIIDSDLSFPVHNPDTSLSYRQIFPPKNRDNFQDDTCDSICRAVADLLNGITPDCYIAANLSDIDSKEDLKELLDDVKHGTFSTRIPLISNCSKGSLIRQINRIRTYHKNDTLTISGNIQFTPDGAQYVVPDQTILNDILLSVFCQSIKS